MAYDFFSLLVTQIWGNWLIATIGWGIIFSLGAVVGRVSYVLLIDLLILYFITFTIGFTGLIIYIPLLIFSVLFFFFNMIKWFRRE